LTIRCEIDEISGLAGLFGPKGLTARNATLSLALEWVSMDSGWRTLGEPWPLKIPDGTRGSDPIRLCISFSSSSIRGIGTLTLQLFLADPGEPTAEESMMARTVGFRFGSLDLGTRVVVDGDGSLFPIIEDNLGVSAPLWEFQRDWTDPFDEEFSTAFLSLALNRDHPDFRLLKENDQLFRWTPLFRQAVASWITILILELKNESPSEFQEIESNRLGRALPGSIADAVAYMLRVGDLDSSSAASLMFSAQQWVDRVMTQKPDAP
jgi:hypothetical protein